MKKTSFECPGCAKNVDQFRIKNHITNCGKYQSNAFCYNKVMKFSEKDNINELKVLYGINLVPFIRIDFGQRTY